MNDIIFIPKKVIIYFHEQLILSYGGSHGIRDENLLDSALEQPKATFGEKYLHNSVMKMAAAYGYHLCKNHPFVDGNKRISLVAMDIFLQRNGFEIIANEKDTYNLIMELASGKLSKESLANWLENNTSAYALGLLHLFGIPAFSPKDRSKIPAQGIHVNLLR